MTTKHSRLGLTLFLIVLCGGCGTPLAPVAPIVASKQALTAAGSAPSGLIATVDNTLPTQVALTWVNTNTTQTSVCLESAPNGGVFTQSTCLSSGTAVSGTITGLTSATAYQVRVRGSNGSTFTDYSNIVTIATPAGTGSGTTLALSAHVVSSKRIDLTWTDSVNGALAHVVEQSTAGGPFQVVASPAAGVTTQTIATGLKPKGSYQFRVRATDSSSTTYPTSDPIASVTRVTRGDYNGDGFADVPVFDASTATTYIDYTYVAGGSRIQQLGGSNVIPIVADFDGDGITDVSIFDVPSATFFACLSAGSLTTCKQNYAKQWGGANVKPVPGDYDGDGIADPAIYDPSTGSFAINSSKLGKAIMQSWQGPNLIPAPGDYDGDGIMDFAVFDPKTNDFYVLYNHGLVFYATANYYTVGNVAANTRATTSIGVPMNNSMASVAIPGDYDGDGLTDVAVFDPSTANFYYSPSSGSGTVLFQFGVPGQETPTPADYDGDGRTDLGIYLSANSQHGFHYSSGIANYALQFGGAHWLDVLGFRN